MKMVLRGPLDIEAALRIAPNLEIVQAENEEALLAASADAEIAVMMNMGWLGGGFPVYLKRAPHLRWFHCSSAGVDPLLCPEFLSSDVVMTCAKGSPIGPLLAEHAFALILSLTRGIAAQARLNRWDSGSDEAQSAYELGGKTLGIVGYGGVGTALAQRARAFDMDVLAVRAATQRALDRARAGEGPTLLECLTYRFRGHSLADPDELRAEQEKQFWAQRDPLKALERDLTGQGLVNSDELRAIEKEIDGVVEDCVEFALAAPEPDPAELTRYIWAED